MKEIWKPYVDYNAFYSRIKRCGWSLYKATHTPLDYKKLEWHEKLRIWLRTQWFRFIYLLKCNEMRRGKRPKNSRQD